VADMMAVPRSSVKFDRVYPEGGLASSTPALKGGACCSRAPATPEPAG
jgi:hypothetical protein